MPTRQKIKMGCLFPKNSLDARYYTEQFAMNIIALNFHFIPMILIKKLRLTESKGQVTDYSP